MKINNQLIRKFQPYYDPSEVVKDEEESLELLEWIEKYRGKLPDKDILWLLLRNEFLSDKQLRLFAVWCAREALKLDDNPDPFCVVACDVAERYTNGHAKKKELSAARAAVDAAAIAERSSVKLSVAMAVWYIPLSAAGVADWAAMTAAVSAATKAGKATERAGNAAHVAAYTAQLNHLIEMIWDEQQMKTNIGKSARIKVKFHLPAFGTAICFQRKGRYWWKTVSWTYPYLMRSESFEFVINYLKRLETLQKAKRFTTGINLLKKKEE